MSNPSTIAVYLESLSFSRYTKLRQCLLSGARLPFVEQEVHEREHLNEGLVFGKFFHSQMEAFHNLVSAGSCSKTQLRSKFNEVLERYETQLGKSSFMGYQGNISYWPEVNDLYKALSESLETELEKGHTSIQRYCEKKLFGEKKRLEGRLDALIIDDGKAEIIDYKSGTLDESDEPKSEYLEQLLLYSALVEENFGVFPTKLSLVDYKLKITPVFPDRERSESIVDDMLRVLSNYNAKVNELAGLMPASPSSAACLYCERKRSCSAFWEQAHELELPVWAQSFTGRQVTPVEGNRSGGGAIEVEVESGTVRQKSLRVVGIYDARYPFIKSSLGKKLRFLDLRWKAENPGYAEVTDRSSIIMVSDEDGDEL